MLLALVRHRATPIAAAVCALAFAACNRDDPPAPAETAAPPPMLPVASAPSPGPAQPAFDVPFRGTYARTAKVTSRNGQLVRLPNAAGTASITIEPGKVTYEQAYPDGVWTAHVTQAYAFASSDMRPVAGGYDVPLTFRTINTDTKGYAPDSRDPKVEARKLGSSWEIGFRYRDQSGVDGGIEFR